MADLNSTLGAFVPTVVSPATSNWGAHLPALIVNPEARLEDLLSWCAVEAAELDRLANMIAGAQADANDVAARFQHRLAPLAQVLDYATDIAAKARNLQGRQHG